MGYPSRTTLLRRESAPAFHLRRNPDPGGLKHAHAALRAPLTPTPHGPMAAAAFDESLMLHHPMSLQPALPGGRETALYFSSVVRNGAERPVCVLARPVDGSEDEAQYAHGTRARVVGASKTIRGTIFVVCSQSHADAAPSVCSHIHADAAPSVSAAAQDLLWASLIFGAVVTSGELARVQPRLHVIDVVAQRRKRWPGAPVTIRCGIDAGEAGLPPNAIVVLRGCLVEVGQSSFTIHVRSVNLDTGESSAPRLCGLGWLWVRDMLRRRRRSGSEPLTAPGSPAQLSADISALGSPASGMYPRVVLSVPGPHKCRASFDSAIE